MLSPEQISKISKILTAGDRVELIPGKDNAITILRIRREKIK